MKEHFFKTLFTYALITAATCHLYAAGYPIDPRNWAILRNKDFIYEPCNSIWQPGYGDASRALNAVFKYLFDSRNNDEVPTSIRTDINRILVQWKLFKVQFAGIVVNGKRMIFCNFFDSRMNAKQWKNEEILTDDTDYYSWSIEYDPVNGTCTNLKAGTEVSNIKIRGSE
jgi:hypothetical protein